VKELTDILRTWTAHQDEPIALATVVRAHGSSYRRPGARMLICSDGVTVGSLSGGCLEEEVAARAREVIRSGTPELLKFDTRLRFGCNGTIEVFVERVEERFLSELAAHMGHRRSCRAVTIFEGGGDLGSRILFPGAIPAANAFLQKIEPPIQLIIFGAGPDSSPLGIFAETLGWQTIEAEQATELPSVVDERTAAIVKSHDYGRDFAALRHLLEMPLRYVGLLGPRKRREQLLHALIDNGVDLEAELFAPAGLDLGAETPEEIALAIVAEIQSVFADASSQSLRDRKVPIHGWNTAPRRAETLAGSRACDLLPR
jgi:xanthine/CO dehydrogenase XdhC/CoxF family maturation factor